MAAHKLSDKLHQCQTESEHQNIISIPNLIVPINHKGKATI